MNRVLFLLISICIFTGTLQSQELKLDLSLRREIPGKFEIFNLDELGSIYAFTSGGQLKKYNANLDSLAVFNDVKRFGKLHSIHTENPLRTILYFKNFNTLVLLDRMMQMIQKIDLRKSNLFQVSAVAPSYDNKIWVFDVQNSKIKKINFDGSVAFESADLRMVFDEQLNPVKIIEHQGSLYLLDSATGVYQFDYYGSFKKKLLYPHTQDIQSWGDAIVGFRPQELWIKRDNELDILSVKFPERINFIKQLYVSAQTAYILHENTISLYTFTFNK